MLNDRLQVLVTPEQRRRLEAEASRTGASVASLVRAAIDARFAPVPQADRLRALERIRARRGQVKALSPEEINRIVEEEREEILLPPTPR